MNVAGRKTMVSMAIDLVRFPSFIAWSDILTVSVDIFMLSLART